MRKIYGFILAMCISLVPLLQSCGDDDGYSVGDFTPPLWATVRTAGTAFYLDCDVWGTLWPVNTDMGWYKPIDGQRVITVFNPLWDNYGGYDHAVKILDIKEVLTKNVETLTTETEEEFGNDPVRLVSGGVSISNGYMNIAFLQNLPQKEKHRISLVRPQDDNELYGEDGYIHLQLRYNSYEDLTGVYAYGLVSYNLNSLEVTGETKGIKLKVNSEEEGETEMTFDIVVQDAEGADLNNQDLTKMQIR